MNCNIYTLPILLVFSRICIAQSSIEIVNKKELEMMNNPQNYFQLIEKNLDLNKTQLQDTSHQISNKWSQIFRKGSDEKLMAVLDAVYINDQKYRQQIDAIESKYGWQSKEMQDHWKLINYHDSINLIKVTEILDKNGWLGPDVVGRQGSSAIFLVIQHSDIAVQEKYLPMMREAVKNKKAQGSNLALLEDRVALRQGKKQIYGSQIGRDDSTGKHYVLPLEDPDHVDRRRAEVGLPPLSQYASNWQIVWDVEQYKKDLPFIESLQK